MPRHTHLRRVTFVAVVVALWWAMIAPAAAGEPAEEPRSAPATVYLPSYLDIDETSPFLADIRALSAAGITHGCDRGRRFFCGDDPVSRGQMAAFLVRGLGLGETTGDASVVEAGFVDIGFVDIGDTVFRNDVAALGARGITRGCNPPASDRFCPDEPVTRGQMAAFLVRALDLGRSPAPSGGFVDDDGSVFEGDIARLAEAGITRGCNPSAGDRFCPERLVTRRQMAAFLVRALELPGVPPYPPDVTVTRETGDVVGSRVTVCPVGEEAPPVEVRHAAWGAAHPTASLDMTPTTLTWSAGSYDPASDVWTTGPITGCVTLESGWNPDNVELAWPLPELTITSPFGPRNHPILGGRRMHKGVDLAAPSGTTVRAAAGGEVVTASTETALGRTVAIRHAGGLTTGYSHLSSISVNPGDTVAAGDPVGRVGCTGYCTGPHLHFETREWGEPVDPVPRLGR